MLIQRTRRSTWQAPRTRRSIAVLVQRAEGKSEEHLSPVLSVGEKSRLKLLSGRWRCLSLLTDDEWNQYYYYLSIPSGQHPELERLTKEKYNR